ncbi:class I SAM-dependent methyltransferase [Candidatus Sumerlaeota bacterium]|nr:class I SAM-dependent methyltransferase [Candidatus Sumerlaeota bacterium]
MSVSDAITPEQVRAHLAKRRSQGEALGMDMDRQYQRLVELIGDVGGPLLDIGTGKGRLATVMASAAPLVVSLDPSDEDRPFARIVIADGGAADRVALLQGVGERLPFTDGCFGAVVSHQALHHFEDPAAILREMVRVAQPGGVIVASDFDAAGFDVIETIHQSEGRHHPIEGWPVDRAAAFLADLGLDVRVESGPMMTAAVARLPVR